MARLTDRQIHDVLFRPRREDGSLEDVTETPQKAAVPGLSAMEEDRIALFTTGAQLGVPHEELVATWQKKYGSIPWQVEGS